MPSRPERLNTRKAAGRTLPVLLSVALTAIALPVLADVCQPFTRCMECNEQIRPVSKRQVTAMLETETAASFDEFWHCPGCGRIYWKGSHYDRLAGLVASVLDRSRPGAQDSAGGAR